MHPPPHPPQDAELVLSILTNSQAFLAGSNQDTVRLPRRGSGDPPAIPVPHAAPPALPCATPPAPDLEYAAALGVQRMTVVLVDDSSGCDFPLFEGAMEGLRGTMASGGGATTVVRSLLVPALWCSYYNPNNCEWEPALEPVDVHISAELAPKTPPGTADPPAESAELLYDPEKAFASGGALGTFKFCRTKPAVLPSLVRAGTQSQTSQCPPTSRRARWA